MFHNIVVGTDGSATAGLAVRHAAALAKMCGARLHLVRATSSSAMLQAMSADAAAAMTVDVTGVAVIQAEEVAVQLRLTAADLVRQGLEVETYGGTGDAARLIVDVATAQGADLIVVGNKGMAGARRLLGSVPNKIAHSAPCNVLIVYTR